jgi:hypothetical protein
MTLLVLLCNQFHLLCKPKGLGYWNDYADLGGLGRSSMLNGVRKSWLPLPLQVFASARAFTRDAMKGSILPFYF